MSRSIVSDVTFCGGCIKTFCWISPSEFLCRRLVDSIASSLFGVLFGRGNMYGKAFDKHVP